MIFFFKKKKGLSKALQWRELQLIRKSFPGPERLSSSRFRLCRWRFLLLGWRLLGRQSLGHSARHLLGDGRFGFPGWSGFLDRRRFSGWRYLLGGRFVIRGWGFLRWCRSLSGRRLSAGSLGFFSGWRLTLSGRGPLLTPVWESNFSRLLKKGRKHTLHFSVNQIRIDDVRKFYT